MVSIIVPAYNVEAYLAACLDSALAQTEADWELIAVDDGSADGTGGICDAYAARDARIRCVHQSNAGVAAARNRALELARGEYLLFLDGDDQLSPTLIERLLARMEPDIDIVCCGFTAFSEASGLEQPRSFLIGNRAMRGMTEKEPLFLQLHDGRVGQAPGKLYTAIGVPWGKLYRAKLIRERGLRFPPMRLYEDNIFNMYAFTYARGVAYLDEPLYRYRVDHCSSNALTPEVRLRVVEARDEYYERCGEFATSRMWEARFREKMRWLGASCTYYAGTMRNGEAARAIKALCEREGYAGMLRERFVYPVTWRYRLLTLLMRAKLWRCCAALSRLAR